LASVSGSTSAFRPKRKGTLQVSRPRPHALANCIKENPFPASARGARVKRLERGKWEFVTDGTGAREKINSFARPRGRIDKRKNWRR